MKNSNFVFLSFFANVIRGFIIINIRPIIEERKNLGYRNKLSQKSINRNPLDFCIKI